MWPFTSTPRPEEQEAASRPGHHIESYMNKAQQDEQIPYPAITGYANERLSIPFILRAPMLMISSFVAGFTLGAAHGAPIAAYRYRAENAHRMPKTQTGWFLYQKSKNYHSILGGVKEGVRFGGVLTGWATLFMVTEEMVDRARSQLFAKGEDDLAPGQRDAASTVIAAMSTAGIYSWKKGMDQFTAARTARIALKYSVLFGLVQDAAASLRGSRPAYVDWLVKKTVGVAQSMEMIEDQSGTLVDGQYEGKAADLNKETCTNNLSCQCR